MPRKACREGSILEQATNYKRLSSSLPDSERLPQNRLCVQHRLLDISRRLVVVSEALKGKGEERKYKDDKKRKSTLERARVCT